MACSPAQYGGTTQNGIAWSNWAGLAGGNVGALHRPASLGDIVKVVQDAEAAGQKIRVVGSGWAFEDIAYSPDVMVSLANLNSILTYITDPTNGALIASPAGSRTLVHVEAGITIAKLNSDLAAIGLAMPTLGGANGQTLVGAISTSTHGADLDEPPFCDLVRAIHLVGAGGEEYWLERHTSPITLDQPLGRALPCGDTSVVRDDETFDAVVVGLGRFGIIYSVVVETVPAYSLARERVQIPLAQMLNLLRQGIANPPLFAPLMANLPAPSANLNAQSTGSLPRAMELVIDTRNPGSPHIVRRWNATGPNIAMAFDVNPLCAVGANAILLSAAAAIIPLGMNPAMINNPLLLLDPTRPARLSVESVRISTAITQGLTAGEGLALITNAYWNFGITQLPNLLALVVYHGQFKTQRGPSYDVMTGDPAFNTSTCYRANSCEIMFDATDPRYVDFVEWMTRLSPSFNQAGYISLRYSQKSRALLSMHNVAQYHAVSIEVSTLKGLSDAAAWVDLVLRTGQAFGGRPHWGQENRPQPAELQALYGPNLDRWRAALGGFPGGSTAFSSNFTISRSLEPQGSHVPQFNQKASALAAQSAPQTIVRPSTGAPQMVSPNRPGRPPRRPGT